MDENFKQTYKRSFVKENSENNSVSYLKLFRYADAVDILLLFLMVISSIMLGLVYPANIILFKYIVNIIGDISSKTHTLEYFKPVIYGYLILSLCAFIAGFIQMTTIYSTTSRQTKRLKCILYKSILRQDISWFSIQDSGTLISAMSENIESFQIGIGAKLSNFIIYISASIGCLLIAIKNGLQLSLYGIFVVPLLVISFIIMSYFLRRYTIKENEAYSSAGSVAEEILSSIKTVISLNAQNRELQRYIKHLENAEIMGIKKAYVQGIGMGLSNFSVFIVASVIFYNGFYLMISINLEPGVIIQVFSAMVMGSAALGFAIPILEYFSEATVAAYKIYEIADRISAIDIYKKGIIQKELKCKIIFNNVWFEYPTRPGMSVLKNFNLVIEPGETVALVGPSGSGKSSIIALLQRFYDPVKGNITVNSINLKDLDVQWYRSNISVVHQEAPIFSGTIFNNIRMGKLDATILQVEKAAQDAHAFKFIDATKKKFETILTDKGSNFSGGQKQRIAIATALIRKPKLLLLDEATSALDNISENIVQTTLDQAIAIYKMTVVVVAHRLSTIKNATRILVLKNGEIIEEGNHDQLMEKKGWYYEMFSRQDGTRTPIKLPSKSETKSKMSTLFHKESEDSISTEKSGSEKDNDIHHFYRILSLNKPERYYIYIGIVAAFFSGLGFPIAAIIYSEMYKVFTLRNSPKDMIRQGSFYSILMLIPALLLLISQIVKHAMFGISGEILTTRLRSLLFRSMIFQDMAWFSDPNNAPGILTSRLAVEASLVKGISGLRIGILVEGLSTVLAAFSIAFSTNWKLTLIMLIFIPLIIAAGVFQGKHSAGQINSYSKSIDSNGIVLESINNIKIVVSLGLQAHFFNLFSQQVLRKNRSNLWNFVKFGVISGIAASTLYYSYAVTFFVGSLLIQNNQLEILAFMRVFSALTMSMSALGRTLTLAPDISSASKAATDTLATIDLKSKRKNYEETIDCNLEGKIEFDEVYFRYPNSCLSLKGLSFTIQPGQTVAFVGASGSGKSTIIQLLERFYNTYYVEGHKSMIRIDDVDIKNINIKWLRDNLGWVSQEPVLFNLTIKENILYSNRKLYLTMVDVVEAAKMANIHEFIISLPMGYETMVGQRGSFLSGGQKQRICIARALIGKPPILFLDEATSALDAESETLVQASIEKIQKNLTCLIVAHRLSTVRYADKIFVIDHGKVVESGTHDELMNFERLYFRLFTTSS